ncbi:MAG: MerR family transcriptional regulator [Bacteroidetes bacterium]|nr:MerR family transcriptional regulator [Bacteroidota bacterium]MBS1756354.1 MerR family transcriptional regulator [Bacteroidota bacterium]
MALKQSSFNFDFVPEEKPVNNADVPDKEEENVDDEVREVEITVEKNTVEPVLQKKSSVKKSTRGRMKLSDMNAVRDLIEIPEDEVLFEKSYYSIGTVSEMFKVNVSLIRFWENEFDILKPKKNGKGDRLFRPEDVKNLKMIYHLLRDKKYTIEGAREFLKKNKKAEENYILIENLKKLKSFLTELKANF